MGSPTTSDHPVGAVLFDADGVVQTTPAGWVEAIAEFVDGEGGERFRDEVFAAERPAMAGEMGFAPVLAGVAGRWGLSDRLDELLDHWFRIQVSHPTVDVVQELRAEGVRCYLVTNQHDHRARCMRSELGYDELFDGQFYSCDLGVMKPASGYFESVLRSVQLPPASAVLVDDQERNVREAEGLGLRGMRWSVDDGARELRTRLRLLGLPV
ncbi:MAG: HAD family hydrolase [Nocardioidaceae bacterium]